MNSPRFRLRRGALLGALCLLLPFTSAHAAAPEPPEEPAAEVHLGVPGQWFLEGSSAGLLQALVGPGESRGVSFALSGAAGYFFTEWIFARLGLGVGTSSLRYGGLEPQIVTFTLEPGVGFRVPMGRQHAFLPSLSYAFGLAQDSTGVTDLDIYTPAAVAITRSTSHGLNLRLAFSVALVPHLNLLVGPAFTQTFTTAGAANAQTSRFTAALEAGLLGYF